MNRKHVSGEMDSGLGSDEDRRGRTKEQKQLHNQQLLSGCFIDAATLSDEADVADHADQRRQDERRQGAILFQTSVPHFSMLQMPNAHEECGFSSDFSCSAGNLPQFPETSTPFNSIVQIGPEEPDSARKSPLGFYVDLSDVAGGGPVTPPSASATKNIFSMVIDFEGPKKDKPIKLSSSLVSYRKSKPLNRSNLLAKSNGSLSSSFSSINSNSVAGTSRQSEEHEPTANCNGNKVLNVEVLSASLVKKLSVSSSKSSSSSENVAERNNDVSLDLDRDSAKESVEENHIECDNVSEKNDEEITPSSSKSESKSDSSRVQISEESKLEAQPQPQQFVRLSDLECQRARVDVNFAPRMSRSIPESSWVESPLLMSSSVGYRSAPRPMEAEGGEGEDEEEEKEGVGELRRGGEAPASRRCVRKLGTDLLRMFLEEIGPDVVVEVEGHKLKAHKCILASRCQYFAALLSGNWLDKSGNVISLQGFSYESVYFALCHIYSGAAHVPDSISLVELASLADTLGLEGLKEVVEHALEQRHCHNFHRPCAGCCTGVLEVLPLSAAYGLDDLYQKCLKWITQHFVRVWPSRAFASLPRELREKCYQQHVVHMHPDKVLDTILQCDKVLATLPSMRWAEPVSQLVLQLTDACHLYHRQHFAAVLGSQYLSGLDSGLGFGVCQIEDQMVSAAKNLGIDQACRSYSRCCKMLDQTWSRPFADLLNKVKLQLEQCLVCQADRLIRSNAWLRLDTTLRSRIKELSPAMEPSSRLPRATSLRPRKPPPTAKPTPRSPLLSSSDSSRNSSPGVALQQGGKGNVSGGSPSLRRSLLLAAKAPQVPPSPTAHRRSTLTQPTAASAARASAARATARGPVRAPVAAPRPTSGAPQQRPTISKAPSQVPSKKTSTTVSRNPSMGKKDAPASLAAPRKPPDSRCGSPLKTDSRLSSPRKTDSRVTSPVKAALRSPSPMKDAPRRSSKGTKCQPVKPVEVQPQPTMQRSSTFLKEEPSVLGKVM
ncbi:unnamed protein product [Phaedon cochleariae]|uniref:BTB domain-containing protein n=1 Tax=Phaedon cochleariae TaxID=80249 RepID=A0A9N9X1R5_PHACE|nr:unnamed protein product [Phaedon cochleariae]